MSPEIGQNSYISPSVKLADDVKIGANCVLDGNGTIGVGVYIGHGTIIEGQFSIGNNTRIDHHVVLKGRNYIGEDNELGSFICLGTSPQDLNYTGKDTSVRIGNGNILREYVTAHNGTHEDTVIGDDNYVMTNVTINHDCKVGNKTILTTQVVLGGYVEVLDYGYLGFGVMCHQFTRVGGHTLVGMNGRITRDIPPFIIAAGEPLKYLRVNKIGLQRRGFKESRIDNITAAYAEINGRHDPDEIAAILDGIETPESAADFELIRDFYKSASRRGVMWV